MRHFSDRTPQGCYSSPSPGGVARAHLLLPSPLWGGVGGGGRNCFAYDGQNTIDVRQHIVVPEPQETIAIGFKPPRPHGVTRSFGVLAAVDLNDKLLAVADKVSNVWPDLHLPAEVCPSKLKTVAQMPPQFSLGLCGLTAHLTRECALNRHFGPIRESPDSITIFAAARHHGTPTPNPSPQGGGEKKALARLPLTRLSRILSV